MNWNRSAKRMCVLFILHAIGCTVIGCSLVVTPDTGRLGESNVSDSGPRDGSISNDGSPFADAGETVPNEDAGIRDAGTADAGSPDTGIADSGIPDAGPPPPRLYRAANATADIWRLDASDLRVTEGDVVFDTSTCAAMTIASETRMQVSGDTYCVLWVHDFLLGSDATLRVSGDLPLAVYASGEIQIDGILDVSGYGPSPGPGGGGGGRVYVPLDGEGPAAGRGGAHEDPFDDGGGGGGGFCGPGGRGGQGGSADGGEAGGTVPAGTTLEPLVAGSGGGRGDGATGSGTSNAGVGGAGGGALQLSALESIEIRGLLLAGGGGGQGGGGRLSRGNWGSAGGGGSGGAILLQAPTVRLRDEGLVNVAGGGGGGSASDGDPGEDGEDGSDTLDAPRGGRGASVRYAADGGGGAGGSALGGAQGNANSESGANGGGGGGGAGCVVIRSDRIEVGDRFQQNPLGSASSHRLPLE